MHYEVKAIGDLERAGTNEHQSTYTVAIPDNPFERRLLRRFIEQAFSSWSNVDCSVVVEDDDTYSVTFSALADGGLNIALLTDDRYIIGNVYVIRRGESDPNVIVDVPKQDGYKGYFGVVTQTTELPHWKESKYFRL